MRNRPTPYALCNSLRVYENKAEIMADRPIWITGARHARGDIMEHNGRPEILPYAEITDEDYAISAAGKFRIERLDGDVTLLHGTCPRCAGPVSTPLVPVVYREASTGERPSEDGEFHVVFCTCDHPHPNRPPDRSGCGAYWGFLLEEGS
jgi:hypothetical protein